MFSAIKSALSRHLRNFKGWTTQRKIVVIESDDWGSIRMPSKEVYKKFVEAGIPVDKSPYCRYDSLATVDDLEALFTTLKKFRDSKNNHPVITANALMANPDFEKIELSGFTEYHFENFKETLKRYPGCGDSFKLWKEGIAAGLFFPQFHGREHINVPLWLTLLQQNHQMLKLAFEHKFWGLSNGILKDVEGSIQAAYDSPSPAALDFQKKSITEGLNLFEKNFAYRSKSFIAGNYIWHPELEEPLAESGIHFIQSMKYQLLPKNNEENRKMIRHYLGDRNSFGLIYLLRNCVFEPSLQAEDFNSVEECLKDIANAFFWNKPAIITMHRLNFIGALETENRSQNLEAFSQLLSKIIERWSEVEFVTSVELGSIIENDVTIKE